MAGMLELSNLDLQCTNRRNKNTGEERTDRRTHRTRAPRTRGSRGDPARAGSGDRRRRSSEKRLRLLGEEKRTPDEIGERGGHGRYLWGAGWLGIHGPEVWPGRTRRLRRRGSSAQLRREEDEPDRRARLVSGRESACAISGSGWARDWAGVAGLRLRRGAFSLAGPSQGKTARSGALAQAVKSAAGAERNTGLRPERRQGAAQRPGEGNGPRGKAMGRGSSRPSGRKEGGEESYSFFFEFFFKASSK